MMMEHETDEYELAMRACAGDREALAELVDRTRLRLFQAAYAELRHYDDAHDAVASALLQICLHIRELREPARLRAWMHRIVSNEVRRLRRGPAAATLRLEEADLRGEEAAPSLLRLDIERALRQLPGDQARVSQLFYLADLSIAEIAQRTGHPIGTIKSWLHRGRQRLAVEMEEYAPMSAKPAPPASPAAADTAVIVHTDLEPLVVEKIAEAVRAGGCRPQILVPTTPMLLLEELKERHVVILDEWIGGRSALEFLMHLRARPETRMIPVCLLCSDPSEFTVAAYFAAGASRLVNKSNPDDFGKLAGPFDSPFYVVRPADAEFAAAIARRESIILVTGPRQVGKTSLLARGLQQAREAGARVIVTDLAKLNAAHLESAQTLLMAFAEMIVEQLELDVEPAQIWDTRRGPDVAFQSFLRCEVLGMSEAGAEGAIVWGMDEVDRLFDCDFGSEIFGLFRSWHNERCLDPVAPWSRLTLAMAYATEAQLFITDLNKSPFNVGTRLPLEDFTMEQVVDLNRRYGWPMKSVGEVARYYGLVGGQPYLVRCGLAEMATHGTDIAAFEARAANDDWIFGDHLQRLRALIAGDSALCEAVRGVLRGEPSPTPMSFHRLRSAGLLAGTSGQDARMRCPVYAEYLARHPL